MQITHQYCTFEYIINFGTFGIDYFTINLQKLLKNLLPLEEHPPVSYRQVVIRYHTEPNPKNR